jgi:hypothetical protein
MLSLGSRMSILGNTSLMNFVLECCERQVIEEEFQEKDSRSGKETKHVSRGVGEKGLSVTRKRTSEGREERLDTLHNLNEEEIPDFERTWEEHEKMLPRWNKTRPLGIGSSYNGGSGSRRRAALPSPEDWPTNPP